MIIKQNVNRILSAMLALLLCLSLAACGGDSQSTESTNSNKAGIRIADYLGGISNGGLGSVTRNNDNDDTIESYFTRNGLAINAALDQGAFLMENGFASYEGNTGAGYTVGDCYWEVTKTYDQTQDGIREIRIEALCYVPQSSMGTFDGKPKYSLYHQLYDFYTGKWFTRIDEYKTSSHGDDYYLHTVELNGQSGVIEFTRSTDWQSDTGEWARVALTKYHIFMPEWYDGLVLAIEPLPDNYEGFTAFDHRHQAYATASIMDIDLVDPYGCLFFDICV